MNYVCLKCFICTILHIRIAYYSTLYKKCHITTAVLQLTTLM